MKRALLLLALPVAAHAANWTKVVPGSYVDKASIIKSDKVHKAWTLDSFSKVQATPDGKPYMSRKSLRAYSCADRTTTLLIEVFYAEDMGKGEIVQNIKYEKFSPDDIIPDSAADATLKMVCQKLGKSGK